MGKHAEYSMPEERASAPRTRTRRSELRAQEQRPSGGQVAPGRRVQNKREVPGEAAGRRSRRLQSSPGIAQSHLAPGAIRSSRQAGFVSSSNDAFGAPVAPIEVVGSARRSRRQDTRGSSAAGQASSATGQFAAPTAQGGSQAQAGSAAGEARPTRRSRRVRFEVTEAAQAATSTSERPGASAGVSRRRAVREAQSGSGQTQAVTSPREQWKARRQEDSSQARAGLAQGVERRDTDIPQQTRRPRRSQHTQANAAARPAQGPRVEYGPAAQSTSSQTRAAKPETQQASPRQAPAQTGGGQAQAPNRRSQRPRPTTPQARGHEAGAAQAWGATHAQDQTQDAAAQPQGGQAPNRRSRRSPAPRAGAPFEQVSGGSSPEGSAGPDNATKIVPQWPSKNTTWPSEDRPASAAGKARSEWEAKPEGPGLQKELTKRVLGGPVDPSTDVMAGEEIADALSESAAYSRRERRRRQDVQKLDSKKIVSHRVEEPEEGGAAFGTRKWMLQGVAAGALTLTAVGIPIIGFASGGTPANASQNFNDSLVGGTEGQNVDTPQSLTGDSSAALRSVDQEVSVQAEDSPTGVCEVDGAQGIRAAYAADQSNAIVMPLKEGSYRLTSSFGYRVDPISGTQSSHAGQDFGAPTGTPIYAVADGTVKHAGAGIQGRSNNLIIIEHQINGEKFYTWYVHMYDDGVLVNEGDTVSAGDQIGLVGSNGNSTGPHLHLEVHDANDQLVDPVKFLQDHQAGDVSGLCG